MAVRSESGLALLEVLVALIVLGLVVVGCLRLFQGSHRLFARSSEWSAAAAYATDGMERVKLMLPHLPPERVEELPGGLQRRTSSTLWQPGVSLVQVVVALPAGGALELRRLVPADEEAGR